MPTNRERHKSVNGDEMTQKCSDLNQLIKSIYIFLILKKTIFTVGKLPSIHYCQINYLIPSLDNTIDLEIVGFAIYDGMY